MTNDNRDGSAPPEWDSGLPRGRRWTGMFWSILFLLVPVLGVASFVVAPWFDHWLPRDVSVHGRSIDGLFYFILVLTGVVFVATEVQIGRAHV